MNPSDPAAAAPEPAPRPASRYAAGTTANMVRSMLLIVVLLGLVYFFVPRPTSFRGPAVDVTTEARRAAQAAGYRPLVATGLPQGWSAVSARYVRSTHGIMTWSAGYRLPDGSYASVEQAKGATRAWEETQTNRSPRGATVTAAGRQWITLVRDNKVQNSLLSAAPDADGVTTLLTGTATLEQLGQFAAYLQPVTP